MWSRDGQTRWLEFSHQALGLGQEDIDQLHREALIHDIGKIGIPDAILLSPDP